MDVGTGEKIQFGEPPLSAEELKLKQEMNAALLDLCGELPEPLQGSAAIFLSTTAGTPPGRFDFIRVFYAPLWTILYHLSSANSNWTANANANDESAIRGQAMAMLLHLLDDHMVDGDQATNHMLLQLRTQAWKTYEDAVRNLSGEDETYRKMSRGLIDDYFAAVHAAVAPDSLESYLEIFRRQIGTWLVLPMFLAGPARMEDVRYCIEQFAIAWRILDDIQDLEKDAARGTRTAVYFALSPAGREDQERLAAIGREADLIPRLLTEIRACLSRGADKAKEIGLDAYGDQIEALMPRVSEGQNSK